MEKIFARQISAEWLALSVAVLLALAANLRFWRAFADAAGSFSSGHVLMLAGAFAIIALVFHACLVAASFRPIAKPVLVLLVMTASLASYFMDAYGVVIDRGMVQNILETDLREARELLNWRLALNVGLLGVLPSLFIAYAKVRFPAGLRGVLRRAGMAAASMLLAVAVLMLLFKDLAPVLREHRELRYLLTPTNVIQAIHGYVRGRWASPVVVAPLGRDAVKGGAWTGQARRTLTVIVVGETARASSFSLNGNVHDTNPELAAEDGLVNFSNVSSCGTATAVSIPCVFSALGREQFSQSGAEGQEGLLDVLVHAGFEVRWRDNNSGCKGVCKRVAYEEVGDCGSSGCHDERLLDPLPGWLRDGKGDMVIVLHQEGSHGPEYARRYPAAFGKFGPVCNSNRFDACSRESIMAAYENTILYTDHLLAQTIRMLRAAAEGGKVDTAMLYFSDHGESLGENNMYLHGAPYFMAPPEQTRVPMMFWMSDGFAARFRIDRACLHERRKEPLSHDNVFHSVLGMLDVNTAILNPSLDLFHGCRTGGGSAHA